MQDSRLLTLSDLALVLEDLLTKRSTSLAKTAVGAAYRALLERDLGAIRGLPEVSDGRPLAEALAETDAVHDGLARAIEALTRAYLAHPSLGEEVRGAAERVREAFVPDGRVWSASYADEAARARARREVFQAMRGELERFPALTAEGVGSLADWVEGFLEAGERLGELLSDRGDARGASRTEAARLRSRVLGHLSRLRGAVADELLGRGEAGSALDGELFGYMDTLVEQRAGRRRATEEAESEAVEPGGTSLDGGSEGVSVEAGSGPDGSSESEGPSSEPSST